MQQQSPKRSLPFSNTSLDIATQNKLKLKETDSVLDSNYSTSLGKRKTRNRCLMVLIYGITNFSIGFMSAPLAPIAKSIKRAYGRSLDQINLASSIFSFAGLLTGFLANYMIHKCGIRKTTILATFLYSVGMALKLGIGYNFYLVHLGEVIAGMGAPFVQNGIGNFAEHWFDEKSVSV